MLNKTILIVEDEAEIADALVYVLKSEGMTPVWVNTAKAAMEQFELVSIDFAILDVGLPDANGFDLFKRIRKNHEIPMMFLTARAEEIDRIVGLEIGADDYVVKPFSPREVAVRVKNILKRAGADSSAQVRTQASPKNNGFEIDPQQLQISYQAKMLHLTRSEYMLLACLLNKPKKIFSRRQLIEAVWSSHHPSDDRVIDSHIKSLRQKLKNIASTDDVPIITHRGFGYSLLK
jgi:two-component system, OmpR family, catabolic regulation response regulator CreB